MLSGRTVGTSKTPTWAPFSRSKAARRFSRDWRWASLRVPVRSVTRAFRAGTGTWAQAAVRPPRQRSSSNRRNQRRKTMSGAAYLAGAAPKSTLGAVEMACSFSTEKLALGW